ncbi:unnamed protein product [Scytosiphon promiscuus]
MTSYLTRRQQHHASHANPHTLEPFSAALIPNHERGSLLQTSPGGRNRRRGSPFAALSEAYKPARAAVFSGPGGRDRGEVLGLRSSSFGGMSWLKSSAEQRLPTATRSRRNLHQKLSSEVRITTKPVVLLPARKRTDESAVLGRWMSSSSSSSSSSALTAVPQPSEKFAKKMAAAAEVAAEAEQAAAAAAAAKTTRTAAASGTGTAPPSPRRHRKSVSWPQDNVIRSIHQLPATPATQSDVYSPDLQALEIARRLAILTRDPELRRAASAVDACRRHAAQVVRTLTSDQNGGLEGVEEACRLYNWREAAFLRETDELVRRIVVGAGQERVWRLKASFRAARRRMQDADSD